MTSGGEVYLKTRISTMQPLCSLAATVRKVLRRGLAMQPGYSINDNQLEIRGWNFKPTGRYGVDLL